MTSSVHVVDLLAPLRIGDAAVIERNGGIVYGRITALSGHEYQGERALITVMTPHGTTIEIGRFWVRKIADDDPTLREHEEASRGEVQLYKGVFDDPR